MSRCRDRDSRCRQLTFCDSVHVAPSVSRLVTIAYLNVISTLFGDVPLLILSHIPRLEVIGVH